jgi:serine/threonine protein kinase
LLTNSSKEIKPEEPIKMGNAAYRQTTTNPNLDQDLKLYMQTDLPKFVWQDKIGNGKFMKSYVMRVESTQVLVKVYMKLSDEDLTSIGKLLTLQWKLLSPTKFPSLMPYQMWIKSTSRMKSSASSLPVYLIRQYFHSNLYDRLSTRPFLNNLEKYWIIYQLLKCLEICHEHNIVHGDLKPENIMVTTSYWIILTDFSSFKPVQIPDDDPTNFQFYFDCMARNKCYLAPERFKSRRNQLGQSSEQSDSSSSQAVPGPVVATTTGNRMLRGKSLIPPAAAASSASVAAAMEFSPAMDVFSLGCVIAEVLLDGNHLLDLPRMLQYLSSSAENLAPSSSLLYNKSREDDDSLLTSPTSTKADQEENLLSKQLLSRIKNPLLRSVSFAVFGSFFFFLSFSLSLLRWLSI